MKIVRKGRIILSLNIYYLSIRILKYFKVSYARYRSRDNFNIHTRICIYKNYYGQSWHIENKNFIKNRDFILAGSVAESRPRSPACVVPTTSMNSPGGGEERIQPIGGEAIDGERCVVRGFTHS